MQKKIKIKNFKKIQIFILENKNVNICQTLCKKKKYLNFN